MNPVHANLGIQIREIMTRDVATLRSTSSVEEAAKLMLLRDVGWLPVLEDQQIVGLVTDRDLVTRVMAEGRDPGQTPIQEVMTTEVIYCYEDEDVKEAIDSMEFRQIRRVLVLNRSDRLAGVLSIGDLAVDLGNRGLAGEVLQKVSEPQPFLQTPETPGEIP